MQRFLEATERVLTPRGRPGIGEPPPAAAEQARKPPSKIKNLFLAAAERVLTPRSRRAARQTKDGTSATPTPPPADPATTLRTRFGAQAQREQGPGGSSSTSGAQPARSAAPPAAVQELRVCLSGSDSSGASRAPSDADSDDSSLDGFAEYVRRRQQGLEGPSEGEQGWNGGDDACDDTLPPVDPDKLPSPRKIAAPVHLCTPRPSERETQRAEADFHAFLTAGELPPSRQRLVHLLALADSMPGEDCFAELMLSDLTFQRTAALLAQLLVLLPLQQRSAALVQLRGKLATHLQGFLGTRLERVVEGLRSCDSFCWLPFSCAAWLLEHAPCDRGETVFDLANMWVERQQRPPAPAQQQQLAALVWQRKLPMAADFTRCMAANVPFAAEYVMRRGAVPKGLLPSLSGAFSFSGEFELHDLLDLQQEAQAHPDKRPRQQTPAVYCGGYCWYCILVGNGRQDRFELYLACSALTLHQETFQCSLLPAADVRFLFQGTTTLADWSQANSERLAACHNHWGGAVFRAGRQAPAAPRTARGVVRGAAPAAAEGGAPLTTARLQPLSMDGLVEEVRASCPCSWGGSLRVRVALRLG